MACIATVEFDCAGDVRVTYERCAGRGVPGSRRARTRFPGGRLGLVDDSDTLHETASRGETDAHGESVGLDDLVTDWLTVPDVADRLGVGIPRVRRLLDDQLLLGVRRGRPRVLSIPSALVEPEPLAELPGTLTVLADAGFTPPEALRWLFSPDDTLPGSPVEALRAGRKTEVRRRAQALGF